MTSALLRLCKGRMALALEGGYNLHSIARGAVASAAALVEYCSQQRLGVVKGPGAAMEGGYWQQLATALGGQGWPLARRVVECLEEVQRTLSPHWRCLKEQPNLKDRASRSTMEKTLFSCTAAVRAWRGVKAGIGRSGLREFKWERLGEGSVALGKRTIGSEAVSSSLCQCSSSTLSTPCYLSSLLMYCC